MSEPDGPEQRTAFYEERFSDEEDDDLFENLIDMCHHGVSFENECLRCDYG